MSWMNNKHERKFNSYQIKEMKMEPGSKHIIALQQI